MKIKKLPLEQKSIKNCAKHNLISKGLSYINQSIGQVVQINPDTDTINYIYIMLVYKNNPLIVGVNIDLIDEYLIEQKIYAGIEYLNNKIKKVLIERFACKMINFLKINELTYFKIIENQKKIEWIYLKVNNVNNGFLKINCGKWLCQIELETKNKVKYKCLVEQYQLMSDISSIKQLGSGDVIVLDAIDGELKIWEVKNNIYKKLNFHQNENCYELRGDWYSNMSIKKQSGNLKAKMSFVVDEITLSSDDLAGMTEKQYIKLDKQLDGNIDIYVNGFLFGQGKLIAIDDSYGVKITQLC